VQIVRLSMLSLLAVFKDVLPGYRIRLPTEKELAMPVSKDVKRTRDYEATLLRLYQVHLCARASHKRLDVHADLSSVLTGQWVSMRAASVKCQSLSCRHMCGS
jgi:Nucleolar complex-associated protein